MKRLTLFMIFLLYAPLVWSAGTVAGDYLELDTEAAHVALNECSIDYLSTTQQLYVLDNDGWYSIGPEAHHLKPCSASPITAEGVMYYDSDDDRVHYRTGAGVWEPAGQITLDEAYEYGATTTIDSGSTVTYNNAQVDATDSFNIANSGAAGTGQAIEITDTKSGAHATMIIDHTSGNIASGGLHIRDNAANAAHLAYGVHVESTDATTAILDAFKATAGTNLMISDGLDVSAANIDHGINLGANEFIGTTSIFDFDYLDMDAAGDFVLSETGGNNADPDFQVLGYGSLRSGELGGNGANYTTWTSTGYLTFVGEAKPVWEEIIYMDRSDLAIAGGDGTAPTASEADTNKHWYYWAYTEGVDVSYHTWRLPAQLDESEDIEFFVRWNSEDAGGDGCTWVITYCLMKDDNNEVSCDPTTALDTVLVEDTTDVQYEWATTNSGVINGGTVGVGETMKIKLQCSASRDSDTCNAESIRINFRIDFIGAEPP